MDRVRRVPKSRPGPVLDIGGNGNRIYFILIYLFIKTVRDEEANREFPTGREDTLRRPPQRDPTRDLSVCWMRPDRRGNQSGSGCTGF